MIILQTKSFAPAEGPGLFVDRNFGLRSVWSRQCHCSARQVPTYALTGCLSCGTPSLLLLSRSSGDVVSSDRSWSCIVLQTRQRPGHVTDGARSPVLGASFLRIFASFRALRLEQLRQLRDASNMSQMASGYLTFGVDGFASDDSARTTRTARCMVIRRSRLKLLVDF